VIRYVTEKYGTENVAQIITFGKMQAKAVVRDVGRVLDLPYKEVDAIAKLIPNTLNITLDEALEQEPRLTEGFFPEDMTDYLKTAPAERILLSSAFGLATASSRCSGANWFASATD
jgi:DNA polymerase III alpha subunit